MIALYESILNPLRTIGIF